MSDTKQLVARVLLALRDPTAAMRKAGENTPVSHSWSADGEFICDPEYIWRAMVDAAMKELA